jgi:protein-disulfide isomerase
VNIHGPSLAIGAGIAVISIMAVFIAMDNFVSSSQPLILEAPTAAPVQPKPTSGPEKEEGFAVGVFTANGSPYLGDENAPITLIEFGDYQCFFCNKFFHETEQGILENYVNTGKVKIIFKDYTIIGPDSITAAHGAHCASDQGKFWEFHDTLYNNWGGENNGWASSDNVHGFAQNLNLDMEEFSECMQNKIHQSKIILSGQDAQTLGLTGTPAFFVIGIDNKVTKIPGAQPYEVFQKIFDDELQ